MKAAEDLTGITRISDVAIVLVPESLMPVVVGIPMDDVAMLVPVPDGVDVRKHTGALVMGGEALAGPGVEDSALIVMGTLILTSPAPRVTYRQVIVTPPEPRQPARAGWPRALLAYQLPPE